MLTDVWLCENGPIIQTINLITYAKLEGRIIVVNNDIIIPGYPFETEYTALQNQLDN